MILQNDLYGKMGNGNMTPPLQHRSLKLGSLGVETGEVATLRATWLDVILFGAHHNKGGWVYQVSIETVKR